MLELLEKLCLANAPSGFEDEVREIIVSEIAPHVSEIRTDRSGNLIALKNGRKKSSSRVMLCAHMDEVGMMISWIDGEGYLKFNCLGGIDDRVLCGRRVRVGKKRLPGVIVSKPIHLIEGDDRKKATPVSQMYIDIGCSTKVEAEKLTRLGDYACFESSFERFGSGGGLIRAKALDDRAGCAVLCELLKEDSEYDYYAVFTVCEELGMRGAYTAAYAVAPDIAVVLEGTTAADIADVAPHKRVCALGGGVAFSFMDKSTLYDPALLELARKTCDDSAISNQLKAYVSGGNDSGAIQRTRDGVRMIAASVPVRYLHTANNVACAADIAATLDFARAIVPRLGEIT